jgi:pimeloyl-ACP methyl ester carboxylesterase
MTLSATLAIVASLAGASPSDSLHVLAGGSGPLVVFIPGLFGSAYAFRNVAPMVRSAGYRVAIIEPLGVGSSARPAQADYSLAAQSERIAAVLDTLHGGPAILVAHSLGGAMAFRVALHHPDLVAGIVSLEGGPTEEAVTPGFRRALRLAPLIRLLGGGMVRSKVRGMLVESSGDPSWVTDEAVHGYTDGATRELGASLRAYRAMGRAHEPAPLAPELGKIRCPVRMLVGAAPHDGGVGKEEMELLERVLPFFAIDTIRGVGHYVQEERPVEVLWAVQRLVAGAGRVERSSQSPEADAGRARR